MKFIPTPISDIDFDLVLGFQAVDEGLAECLPLLLFEVLLNLRGGFGERNRPPGTALGDLDDVESERGFHDVADLTDLQREGRVLEGRRRLAADDEPEIAAALRAAVLRVLAGERSEVLAARSPPSALPRPAPFAAAFVPASAPGGTMMRMWLAWTLSDCLNLSGFFS